MLRRGALLVRPHVLFAHADPTFAWPVDDAVGIAPLGGRRALWRERDRRAGAALDAKEPAIGPQALSSLIVGEVHGAAGDGPGAAAVLVHARACAVRRRDDVLRLR